MGKKVTIKDIKRGMLICEPGCVYPHNEVQEIIDIKYNPRAGEPVKDMWGGTVWAEPFAEIITVGKTTGKQKGYTVQSEDSELQDWLTFIEKPEERIDLIYQNRREEVIRVANKNLAEIVQKLQDIRNYPAQLDKDEKMKNLIEYVAKAMLEVF